jgi:hypothetical protein
VRPNDELLTPGIFFAMNEQDHYWIANQCAQSVQSGCIMRLKGMKGITRALPIAIAAGCASKSTPSGNAAAGSPPPPAVVADRVNPGAGPAPTAKESTSARVNAAVQGRGIAAFGFTGLFVRSLGHPPGHRSPGNRFVSGWRMEIASDQGEGVILRDDESSGASQFQGEGIVSGWSEPSLARMFDALSKTKLADEPAIDSIQLD